MGSALTGLAAGSVDTKRGNDFLDLVVADAAAGGVRWLEGRGTGAFIVRSLSPLAGDAYGVALADFDGDEIADVATLDRSQGSVVVAMGRGDGTFGGEISASLGGDLRTLAAVDRFIAVADASSNQVIVLQVEPGGVLSVVDSFAVGSEPSNLSAGDFDSNGLADLAVGNHGSGNVTILRQGGGRAFSTFATIPVGSGVSAVAWGDVTGDGAPDLLVARDVGELVVFRNDSRRSFTRVFAMPVGKEPAAMFVLDDRSPGQQVTGDGQADVVLLHRGANDIGVLAGRGSGQFEVSSSLVVGRDPVGLAVGNFDEDQEGAVDFATANAAGTVSVIRGQGGGAFVAALSFATGDAPVALQISDFDRDGWLDALVVNRDSGTISLLRGNGRGSFRPRQDYAGIPNATLLAVGDFDGDGFVDAALARENEPRISVFPNSISGFLLPRSVSLERAISALLAADVDRDGKADLLTVPASSGQVSVLRSLGANGFEPARVFEVPGVVVSLSIGQIVGDANPDFAVGTADPAGITVFAGVGGAEFVEVGRVDLPAAPSSLVVDDFIVDGVPDIAALSAVAGQLYVIAGNGSGGWRIVTTENVPPDSFGLSAADLNGNGAPDLVVAQREDSTVTVWSGDGRGAFLASSYAVGKEPVDVKVANLNVVSDATGGLAEVITVNTAADTVTVLRNISRATLPPLTPTPTVGPGTPPPPEPPTPLPTRTRRAGGSNQSSGGCATMEGGNGSSPSGFLATLLVIFARWGHRAWPRSLRHHTSARRLG